MVIEDFATHSNDIIFQENYLGEVCIALRYLPAKNKLSAVVMECKNLKKMDVLGLSGKYYLLYSENMSYICVQIHT